ncbi:hypothetical protein O1611_g8306 [Lasiodiplodia mahajangana]|uniref:Uncharacterized protein n=1 Tax=Lasiodiplodia mahajangana TaxID=1108764 RepID=A0ACC2JD85_9PEZI|nr:hypothetical protein O1611_g8306 [Lasiodiplodia mahajangana]
MDGEIPQTIANGPSSTITHIQLQAAQQPYQIDKPGSPNPHSGDLEQPRQDILALGDMVYTHQQFHQYLADHKVLLSSRVVRDSRQPQTLNASSRSQHTNDAEPFPPYIDPSVVLRLGDPGYYELDKISQISSRLQLPLYFEPDEVWIWPEDTEPGWPWSECPTPFDPWNDWRFPGLVYTPDELSEDSWAARVPDMDSPGNLPVLDWDAWRARPRTPPLSPNWLNKWLEELRCVYHYWPDDFSVPGWPWSEDSDENCSDNNSISGSSSDGLCPRESYSRPDGGRLSTIEFGMLNTPPLTKRRAAIRHSQPKKSLNVDSPSFTPAQLGGKKSTFSTSATPFTPRGSSTTTASPALQQDTGTNLFKSTQFADFSQNNYDLNSTDTINGTSDTSLGFDPFMSTVSQGLQSTQYNPYAEEHNPLTGAGASYYGAQNTYSAPSQPLQYHLYYPLAPVRESIQPYQRAAFELFLPESLREDLQKKSEAARQVLASQPGVQSPSLQQYHSLVPLDIKLKNTPGIFGLPTWVWKATSRKNGNVYCLRRVEGFRLTNEDAIKAVNSWKKITHPNIVTTVEAFTTRDFNDSSLVFVHSYHPLSKTLAEHHFPITPGRFNRPGPVAEKVLWSYLVQLSSALKVIHKAKLAARCIDISKVILTDKNRIRLSACSIFDVIHFEAHRRVEDLQQEDFFNLGKLVLSIGTNTPPRNMQDLRTLLDQLGRNYSEELRERVAWLLSAHQAQYKTAEQLIRDLAMHVDDVFISSTNAYDETINHLGRELENGRLVRLLAKLGTINERPEFDGDPNWSETDHRYTLKLFRDYVFHQVDAQGSPVLDLGHIISCLNKLDAGTDERIYLTSRDHQSTFLVTYRELKKQVQSAFGDLQKGNTKQQPQTNRGY